MMKLRREVWVIMVVFDGTEKVPIVTYLPWVTTVGAALV